MIRGLGEGWKMIDLVEVTELVDMGGVVVQRETQYVVQCLAQ